MAYFLLHTGQPSAKRLMRQVPRLHTYQSSSGIAQIDTVIRWGLSDESDPPNGRVLNPRDAILRTTSRVKMVKSLRKLGIRCAPRQQLKNGLLGLTQQFRVPVFDMHPLSCFRSDAAPVWINQRIQRIQDNFEEVSVSEDRLTRRVIRLSTRTLHALGLDFGLVSIGVSARGLLYILDVTPHPVLTGKMLQLFGKAVSDFVERTETMLADAPLSVTLGTDMELMLRNPVGKMVLASNYFTRKGRVGCDDRSVRMDGKRLPLLELRPNPEDNPLQLVTNLRDAMVEASSKINRANVEWRAGSMPFKPYSTGGHIHFSGVQLSSHLIKVLDQYLAIPLMLVEATDTASQRRPKYGFLGDFRQKEWGFEYRTPASFIVSREVTTAAYCLAYVIAVHHFDLPTIDIYEPAIEEAFYTGDSAAFIPIMQRNVAVLRRLRTYERFQQYIEPLFLMSEAGTTWDEGVDVRTVWDIPLKRPVAKTAVRRTRQRRQRARATG
ncbi:hypothetical protein [Alicyclobacillus sp. SO9]|uniref:putative amidoligase domain-containing protein n=1 Tax=Alicyclobacillus sp. SO9 TaxID=2665646 RepID=UPI0018E81AE4|nr:hypothetical protein [Alicyclobacillus sp. SO9]QQE80951.1 hypothetical protein GI364_11500 [Alicyclobacillus sp. SO9]